MKSDPVTRRTAQKKPVDEGQIVLVGELAREDKRSSLTLFRTSGAVFSRNFDGLVISILAEAAVIRD